MLNHRTNDITLYSGNLTVYEEFILIRRHIKIYDYNFVS